MNFNRSLLILFIFLLVNGIFGCSNSEYVEYRPHYLSDDNETKYYGDSKLDSSQLKNIVQVLEYYGHDYKITPDNKVLIKRELNNDWELVWNFTDKSENTYWLKENKPHQKQQPTTKAKNH